MHDTLGNGRKFRTFTLDDTPGHVFGRGEFIDALSCMALPMLFQWDAHFVSATGQLIAFVSHEGYVDLICRDDRVYATLRDRLKDFDPEDL